MIKFETIIAAKNGDKNATLSILNYYTTAIRDFSEDEDFTQMAYLSILQGINDFKNKKN